MANLTHDSHVLMRESERVALRPIARLLKPQSSSPLPRQIRAMIIRHIYQEILPPGVKLRRACHDGDPEQVRDIIIQAQEKFRLSWLWYGRSLTIPYIHVMESLAYCIAHQQIFTLMTLVDVLLFIVTDKRQLLDILLDLAYFLGRYFHDWEMRPRILYLLSLVGEDKITQYRKWYAMGRSDGGHHTMLHIPSL